MQNGKAQFDIIFFDVEILERYNNNPKFLIMDIGDVFLVKMNIMMSLEKMSILKTMELPELFAHVYGTGYNEMPEGYRSILLPTLKNYYDFVLVMEKLVVHNISIKTFQKDSLLISKIERKDEEGRDKGSIVMLQEWLKKNVGSNFDMDEVIVNPIKYIRKIRQVPAHELTNNKYDVDVYEKQKELMVNTYGAVRAIRILFMGHPLAKSVNIPDYLLQGKDIVFY